MNTKYIVFFILLSLNPMIKAADKKEPPAMIAASPPRIEVKLSKRGARSSIKLYNLSKKPVKIKTRVYHWTMDRNNQLKIIPPTRQSLDQWIIINPVEFTIPPKKEQTIRLAVRPFVPPSAGEHRAVIMFEQQIEKNPEASLQMRFRLGVVVYGLAGQIIRQGQLHSIRFKHNQKYGQLALDISSTGNANIRLQGQYSLWKKKNFPGQNRVPHFEKNESPPAVIQFNDLPFTPVLPGTRRWIKINLNLPKQKGHYVLFVQGKLGNHPFKKRFDFRI